VEEARRREQSAAAAARAAAVAGVAHLAMVIASHDNKASSRVMTSVPSMPLLALVATMSQVLHSNALLYNVISPSLCV